VAIKVRNLGLYFLTFGSIVSICYLEAIAAASRDFARTAQDNGDRNPL
jgi:hypothetical protein